jgi:hypothetical protein
MSGHNDVDIIALQNVDESRMSLNEDQVRIVNAPIQSVSLVMAGPGRFVNFISISTRNYSCSDFEYRYHVDDCVHFTVQWQDAHGHGAYSVSVA